jgi:hypothetical protein
VYLPGREWKRSQDAVDSFDTDSDDVDDAEGGASYARESSEAKAEATSSAG